MLLIFDVILNLFFDLLVIVLADAQMVEDFGEVLRLQRVNHHGCAAGCPGNPGCNRSSEGTTNNCLQ